MKKRSPRLVALALGTSSLVLTFFCSLGCHRDAAFVRHSAESLDRLEPASARTIAAFPADHGLSETNLLRASDLAHGDGLQRLSIVRDWCGAETSNTHF